MPLLKDLIEHIPAVSAQPSENHIGTNIALGAGAGLAGGGLVYALSKLVDGGGNAIAKFRVRKLIEDAQKRKNVINESIDPALGSDPDQEVAARRMLNKNMKSLDRQTSREGNGIINDQADSLHTSKILRRVALGALPVAGAGVGYALSKQGNQMTSDKDFAFFAGFTKFAKDNNLTKEQFDALVKHASNPAHAAVPYVKQKSAVKATALASALAALMGGGAGYAVGKSNHDKVAAIADKMLMGLQGAARSGLATKMMGGGEAAANTAKKYFGPGVSNGVSEGMGLPALRAQRAAQAAPGPNLQQRFATRQAGQTAPVRPPMAAPRPNIQPEFAQEAPQAAMVGPSHANRMQTLNSHWNTMMQQHAPAPTAPMASPNVQSQMNSILNPVLRPNPAMAV